MICEYMRPAAWLKGVRKMSKLKMPEISPNFTMEDLYKIREYHSLMWLENPEGSRKDLKDSSAKMQAKIEKVREARKLAAVQ